MLTARAWAALVSVAVLLVDHGGASVVEEAGARVSGGTGRGWRAGEGGAASVLVGTKVRGRRGGSCCQAASAARLVSRPP